MDTEKYIHEIIVTDVHMFFDHVKVIRANHKNVLFRGNQDEKLKLTHKISKEELKYLMYNFKLKYHFAFKKVFEDKNDFDTKCEMNAYSIFTDILAWTNCPRVALFFSLSLDGDFNQTPISDTCIWVAGLNYDFFENENENDLIEFKDNSFFNEDTAKQLIVFSRTKTNQCLTEVISEHNKNLDRQIVLYKIIFENDKSGLKNINHKKDIEVLGVSPSFVYGASKALKQEVMRKSYGKY